ncbi:phosphoribosyltransferase [Nocardioides litoris]|uniref:phosphoribosyltransferase n=1 Tax=Nocardioides litoris TaxID=1926648 RepID=UPI00111E20DD|nr:phosphoribosyltransferase family protein [Nocardioides litoris]
MTDDREVLTWTAFGEAVDDLARQVRADGYQPDLVLSVARGGLALGMGLGYALGVKDVAVINVELYTGVDERLPAPVVRPPTPAPVELEGRTVLVVDDIADTGLTLRHVQQFCAGHVADVRSAVVFEKDRSVVRPDYAWRRTEKWVDFAWSAVPVGS